jgi:hypothetical protein
MSITKVPSTQNFKLMPFDPGDRWENRTPYTLALLWEQQAREQLQPGEACVAAGILKAVRDDIVPTEPLNDCPMNAWILRHANHPDGRPNIEIHIRVTVNNSVLVTSLKDDELTGGKIVDHIETYRQVRLVDECGDRWANQRIMRVVQHSLVCEDINGQESDVLVYPAAMRLPVLFDQCVAMTRIITRWLMENVAVLDEPISEERELALRELLTAPLFGANLHSKRLTHLHQCALGHSTDFPERRFHEIEEDLLRKTRRRLVKANAVSTPEQRQLHTELVKTLKEVRKERSNPQNREIHVSRLVSLHTEWRNRIGLPLWQWDAQGRARATFTGNEEG